MEEGYIIHVERAAIEVNHAVAELENVKSDDLGWAENFMYERLLYSLRLCRDGLSMWNKLLKEEEQ